MLVEKPNAIKANGFDVMEFYHSKSWDGYWLLSEISFGVYILLIVNSIFLVRNGKFSLTKCFVTFLHLSEEIITEVEVLFFWETHSTFAVITILKICGFWKGRVSCLEWDDIFFFTVIFFLMAYVWMIGKEHIYMYSTSCNVTAKCNEIPGLLRIQTYWKYEVVVCWEMLNISWSSGWAVEFDCFCGLFNPKDQFPKTIGNQVNFSI